MTKLSKKQRGQNGEQLACAYLQAQGLKLMTTNYHCRCGEIDLIMLDKDDIVFVEVRSHINMGFGRAIESINQVKIRKLVKTASFFLQERKLFDVLSSRFDVIGIDLVDGKMNYEWIKNAFQMTVNNNL